MVDRGARKRIEDTVRSYLDDGITPMQFDHTLGQIAGQTEDQTVHVIANELGYFYDELEYHKIPPTKAEWNYIYRLLLVVESEAEIVIERARRHTCQRIIATCALALFAILALRAGWGPQLVVLSMPFGVISLLLGLSYSMDTSEPEPLELALTPFSSISQLLGARRCVPHFLKRPYPGYWAEQRTRHPIVVILASLHSSLFVGLSCLVFAPVFLLLQSLPKTNRKLTVKIP